LQEGLIKVLFTTETFAMGLNMPADADTLLQLFSCIFYLQECLVKVLSKSETCATN
jgi:hypothetical protein